MLIHQGKVLKDETTLEENNVVENSFIVIMLSKTKASPSGASTASAPAPSATQVNKSSYVIWLWFLFVSDNKIVYLDNSFV